MKYRAFVERFVRETCIMDVTANTPQEAAVEGAKMAYTSQHGWDRSHPDVVKLAKTVLVRDENGQTYGPTQLNLPPENIA